MPSIADVPLEVFLDNLFPLIPIHDLLSFTSTNKFFARIGEDDTFWKRKLLADFNFSGAETARSSGFKFIYKGLRYLRVFVWGDKGNGRLGMSQYPRSTIPHVAAPAQLRIPNVRVVSLVAGGMSFHALDSEGDIHVWGTMDGTTYALNSDGFSEPGKACNTPHRLLMPTQTRSISCGRVHSTTLDANGHVWTFLSFGRPFNLVSPLLDCSSRDTSPLQIECGWSFSSVLTQGGDVLVWFPFAGSMGDVIQNTNREMDQQGDKKAQSVDGIVPCVTWELAMNPIRLPSLPPLPKLSSSSNAENETRLIKIAALDEHIIGLTNHGHVLKFGSLHDESTTSGGRWVYLPKFSEVELVRQHVSFTQVANDPSEKRIDPPSTMQISHVSAHFRHFVAYSTGSSSIVLIGEMDTRPEDEPQVIPALQNRSVISVVLGDYHYGALTASGELLTWGAYSNGALGLGDPTSLPVGAPGGFTNEAQLHQALDRRRGSPADVKEPALVRFDHGESQPRKRFCFSVTASGWHMGALVFDLEPNPEGDDSDTGAEPSDGPESGYVPLPKPPIASHGPGRLPIRPLDGHSDASIFRVGFPGRGSTSQQDSQSSQSQQDEAPIPIPGGLGRGRGNPLMHHRVGFAGRGTGRGHFGDGGASA